MNRLYSALLLCFISMSTQAQHTSNKQRKKPDFQEVTEQTRQHKSSLNQRTFSSQENFGSTPGFGLVSVFKGQTTSEIEKLAKDAAGNIYAAGEFSDIMELESTTLTDNSRRTVFLAKFNPAGALLWIKQVTSLQDGYPFATVTDLEVYGSTVYLSIRVSDGNIQINNQVTNGQLFLASYSTEGSYNWMHTASQRAIYNLTGAGSENLAVTPESVFIAGASSVEQLDHNGAFIRHISTPREIYSYQIAVHNNQLFFAGSFDTNEIIFGSQLLEKRGVYQTGFVASYDLSQQAFTWASANNQQLPGNMLTQTGISALEIHNNELYLFGNGKGANSDTPVEWAGSTTSGNYEGFAAKFTLDGNLSWLSEIPDFIEQQVSPLASFNEDGNILVYTKRKKEAYWLDSQGQITETISLGKDFKDLLINNSNILFGGTFNYQFLLQAAETNLTTVNWQVTDEQKGGYTQFDGLELDQQGNLYHFGRTAGKTEIFNTVVEGNGLVLAKTNSKGDLIWKHVIENTFRSTMGRDIKVNPKDGTIYITGYAKEPVEILGESFVPGDGWSGFVAKINTNGELQWIQEMTDTIDAVDFDSQDNVYVAGHYWSDFVVGDIEAPFTGSDNAFLIKLNASGEPQWGNFYTGESIEYLSLVAVGPQDEIYYTIEATSRTLQLPDGRTLNLSETDGNIFLVKLKPDGSSEWEQTLAGGDYRSYAWPTSLEVGPNGEAVLNGWTGKESFFGDVSLSSPYQYNNFVATILPDGTTKWASIIKTDFFPFNYNEMEVDENGNVYVGGMLNGAFEFTESDKGNSKGFYIAKYTKEGAFAYAKTVNAWSGLPVSGLALSKEDDLFINGYFYGEASINGSPYNASIASGYFINLSNTPVQPSAPATQTAAIEEETTAFTLTGKGLADEVILQITPAEAVSSYMVEGDQLIISWNRDFTGNEGGRLTETIEVSIAVAYRNNSGQSAFSEPFVVQLNTSKLTGLDDKLFGGLVKLYPNPSASYIQLELPLPATSLVDVEVKDISGRTLSRSSIPSGSHSHRISTENLHNGIYLIQLTLPEGSKALRFIKN